MSDRFFNLNEKSLMCIRTLIDKELEVDKQDLEYLLKARDSLFDNTNISSEVQKELIDASVNIYNKVRDQKDELLRIRGNINSMIREYKKERGDHYHEHCYLGKAKKKNK